MGAWRCGQSGDCCRHTAYVVMTDSERAVLEAAGTSVSPLVWLDPPAPGRQALKAAPCPFLQADNACGVYESRPFTCRRYGCFRQDGEPYYEAAQLLEFRTRTDNAVRSQRKSMQRVAQTWGRAHGWHDGMT